MSIFDNDRIGKSLICNVRHEDTGEERQAFVRWVHAKVDWIVTKRVQSMGEGWLAGPWKVLEVDVPWKGPYA